MPAIKRMMPFRFTIGALVRLIALIGRRVHVALGSAACGHLSHVCSVWAIQADDRSNRIRRRSAALCSPARFSPVTTSQSPPRPRNRHDAFIV